jgi:hypothetical protein
MVVLLHMKPLGLLSYGTAKRHRKTGSSIQCRAALVFFVRAHPNARWICSISGSGSRLTWRRINHSLISSLLGLFDASIQAPVY